MHVRPRRCEERRGRSCPCYHGCCFGAISDFDGPEWHVPHAAHQARRRRRRGTLREPRVHSGGHRLRSLEAAPPAPPWGKCMCVCVTCVSAHPFQGELFKEICKALSVSACLSSASVSVSARSVMNAWECDQASDFPLLRVPSRVVSRPCRGGGAQGSRRGCAFPGSSIRVRGCVYALAHDFSMQRRARRDGEGRGRGRGRGWRKGRGGTAATAAVRC